MSKGIFITFEGTEGSGKSTQVALLAKRLRSLGHAVQTPREPGGTLIGQEIRRTIMHSEDNAAMTPEAELLLFNASRAQLVREVIRPALKAGEIVLCDRFYDSTTAYQGYGRQLDLKGVRTVIDLAIGETHPDLTLLLLVPIEISEARRLARRDSQQTVFPDLLPKAKKKESRTKLPFSEPLRDRMEEADRSFFERVAKGYAVIADSEPDRVRTIDSTQKIETVSTAIWKMVEPFLCK